MYTWRVFGAGLPDIMVKADSFDEAIAMARKVSPNYNGAQRTE